MGFLSLLAPDSYNHQIDTYVATKISDVARHRLALGGGGTKSPLSRGGMAIADIAAVLPCADKDHTAKLKLTGDE